MRQLGVQVEQRPDCDLAGWLAGRPVFQLGHNQVLAPSQRSESQARCHQRTHLPRKPHWKLGRQFGRGCWGLSPRKHYGARTLLEVSCSS